MTKQRNTWPFKTMSVGGTVEFIRADIDLKTAKDMAYTYGRKMGKKFITRKRGDKLTVTRIS